VIRGVVFDFDGVILDTETAEFESWRELFAEHGAELDLDDWVHCVGTTQAVDTYGLLRERASTPVGDRAAVHRRQRQRAHALVDASPLLPGVLHWIEDAASAGLGLAIASNSLAEWPDRNLTRVGLRDRFGHLSCFDGVCAGKPDPYLYLRACDALEVAPHEAIAVEDSPDGVRAATAAGLFCVAVPAGLTKDLDLTHADLVVESLDHLALADAIALVEGRNTSRDQGHR
jgi:HAD superfamily hydrolase (TIGR01509 family)